MSATLHALHICPRCFSELATGVDIAGEPRLCRHCTLKAWQLRHAAPPEPSQTPANPPKPEPDVELWLWRGCIVVLLGIAAGCMLEMLLEAWR